MLGRQVSSFEPFYIPHSSNHISDVYLSSFLLGQASMEFLATRSQALLPVLSFLIYQFWVTACTSSLVLPKTTHPPSTWSDYFPCTAHSEMVTYPFCYIGVTGYPHSLIFTGSLQAEREGCFQQQFFSSSLLTGPSL